MIVLWPYTGGKDLGKDLGKDSFLLSDARIDIAKASRMREMDIRTYSRDVWLLNHYSHINIYDVSNCSR